jgi:hypothetical protein
MGRFKWNNQALKIPYIGINEASLDRGSGRYENGKLER